MLLSNPRIFLLTACLLTFGCQGCTPPANDANKPLVIVPEQKSQFPFSTKEPEVFQGDFVAGGGSAESHTFVARKGDKWRLDIFKFGGTEPFITQLKTDKFYTIDHQNKTYIIQPDGEYPAADSDFFRSETSNFFRGKEYREFEDLGADGGLRKYRVRGDLPDDNILLYIDVASGLIVKQEFLSKIGQKEAGSQIDYIFEIRNLRLEVDDSVFAFPEGYRRVTDDQKRHILPRPAR